MTNLGTLGGTYSQADWINSSAQIVGDSYTSTGADHAFLYSGGSMEDLGALGGTGSVANWINNSGQIVGGYYTSSGSARAFLYSDGSMQDLGATPQFRLCHQRQRAGLGDL